MKITLYELLGLVKDGKAPKKIKYDSIEWTYNYESSAYWNGKGVEFEDYMENSLINSLNDTVEILEEEKKETKPLTKKDIEALGYVCGEIQKCFTNGWTKSLENKPLEEQKKIPEKLSGILEFSPDGNHISKVPNNEQLMFKINEIIDYLESKGDE